MQDIARLSNRLDKDKCECNAIIETAKGHRNKFDFDPESGLFELAGLLPEGMFFPYDFGFIPSTLGEDGDPLDVLVLMDEPGVTGCLVKVRLVGAIQAAQTEDGETTRNDRLIAVPVHSHSHENMTDLAQLNEPVVTHIEKFFVNYNQMKGKKFEVQGRCGPRQSVALVEEGMALFERKNP